VFFGHFLEGFDLKACSMEFGQICMKKSTKFPKFGANFKKFNQFCPQIKGQNFQI
jgi:hypothetical protein